MQPLELLMPAGSQSKMRLALDYGADAVYLGPPLYSLRARDNDFASDVLKESIEQVHARGKKVYMTLNIFSRNRKIQPFSRDITEYAKMKPDAFIISDPGLASIARELAPEIPIHLSVQANCMNWRSVKFWQESLGVERVILSRELSIAEITEIKQRVPDMELEAFVHGSICIAYSGRCLLSSYMDRRDANQGVCDNSCREKYALKEYYIEDTKNNPGQLYEIEEDQHGTYIMNAKDLCMVEHLKPLVDAGVISFKVEGRTKSEFYAAMVARAYRGALDDLINNRPLNPLWSEELAKLSNRGYHTGFMLQTPGANGQNYEKTSQHLDSRKFLGLAQRGEDGRIWVDVRNKIELGQSVQVMTPEGPAGITKVRSITARNQDNKLAVHPGSGEFLFSFSDDIALPENSLLIAHVENAYDKT